MLRRKFCEGESEMSNNYRVEISFKGYVQPEVSYHYDCDNSTEASLESFENISKTWQEKIEWVEVYEE